MDALAERDEEDDGVSHTDAFRIDVGRGGKNAVLYVNDVEKDERYARWPRQVQQMLFAMQYGAPPSVRRNMFTVMAVLDPLADEVDHPGIHLATQLIQGQFPARLGLLIVDPNDVNKCAEWLAETQPDDDVPCPEIKSLFALDSMPDLEMLDSMEATTQAAYYFLRYVVANYSMMAPSYLQYWLSTIAHYKETKEDTLTMKDLIMIHEQLMSGMQVMSSDEAIAEGKAILVAGEDVGDEPSYGMAVRFAASKALQPGMSFLNGRPLPSAEDGNSQNKIGQVFMDEQNHIVKLVMSGVITDNRYEPRVKNRQLGNNAHWDIAHCLF